MVTIVDNAVLYSWNLLRIGLKCFQQQQKDKFGSDECVNSVGWWDSFHNVYVY